MPGARPRGTGQHVPLVCLEVMVVGTEPVEVDEFGRPPFFHRLDVVYLEVAAGAAAGPRADISARDQRRADPRRDRAARVADRLDVDAVRHEDLEEGIGSKLPGSGDRHRSHPRDLAHLAVLGLAANKRGVVNEHMDHVLGVHAGRVVRPRTGVLGHLYQCVRGVRLVGLSATLLPRGSEDPLPVRLERGHHLGPRIRGQHGIQAERSLLVRPGPNPATPVDACVALAFIRHSGRLDARAALLQRKEVLLGCDLQQVALRSGSRGRG